MTSQLAEPSPLEGRLIGGLLDWTLEQPVELQRLLVHLLGEEQKAAALERLQRQKAMQAAYEAELVLSMAADRPARLDPPPGTPGARRGCWSREGELPGVSEFFGAELAVVLNCGRGTGCCTRPRRCRCARCAPRRSHWPPSWIPTSPRRGARPPGGRRTCAPIRPVARTAWPPWPRT
jgi:hypothetical protein